MASTDKHLFHLMAEKMRELAVDGNLVPDEEDLSSLFMVLSLNIGKMGKGPGIRIAEAALGFAGSELSGDMGYFVNERNDCIDWLLGVLAECGVLEVMSGDNHTVYMRKEN